MPPGSQKPSVNHQQCAPTEPLPAARVNWDQSRLSLPPFLHPHTLPASQEERALLGPSNHPLPGPGLRLSAHSGREGAAFVPRILRATSLYPTSEDACKQRHAAAPLPNLLTSVSRQGSEQAPASLMAQLGPAAARSARSQVQAAAPPPAPPSPPPPQPIGCWASPRQPARCSRQMFLTDVPSCEEPRKARGWHHPLPVHTCISLFRFSGLGKFILTPLARRLRDIGQPTASKPRQY